MSEQASDEPPVTAERPDSVMHTAGTDHVTLTGSNEADTVAFYRDVLGMPLVMRQPNLDQPEVTHLFFDTGDGRLLTFFVTDDRASRTTPVRADVGEVHHLAFSVEGDRLEEVKQALDEAGHRYSEFDRGAFHSLYTRDHNGLTIELSADKFAIPDDRRGEVLALAHEERVAEGAEYVQGEHVRAAMEDLGLDVVETDTPGDASAGTGVEE